MPTSKLVVVDCNCLVRLYFSPIRPLLCRPIGGYEFKTLSELAGELRSLARGERHGWLSSPVILSEVDGAAITLTSKQRVSIDAHAPTIRRHGESLLREYSVKKNLKTIRNLSHADAVALTAAIELGAALATDEWPLRKVAGTVDADDDGNSVQLLSSVQMLHMAEKEGLITRDDRTKTYRDWINYRELYQNASEEYFELFGERPPTGQA
jgi:hypothetical protein